MSKKRKNKRNWKDWLLKISIAFIVILILTTIEHLDIDINKEINEILVKAGITVGEEKSIHYNIDLNNIPEYTGNPFIEINNNKPYFEKNDYTTKVFENYSELDSLGRCGVAFANICKSLMPTESRESIREIKPSGWKSTFYPKLVEGDSLYNRCHLIAYQLAGENANAKNLITGTRYLNVEGMLPFENKVNDYIRSHNRNHVLYRVTPIFEGKNLVASGVEMEGYSIEDNGKGICFNIYAYNVQPGVVIDYATGNSHIEKNK